MDEDIRAYDELVEKLLALSVAYYDKDAPLVSDYEYDRMNNRLKALETAHPDWIRPDSPTQHDFDRRFQLEDEGFLAIDDRMFRWDMLDAELNYRLF